MLSSRRGWLAACIGRRTLSMWVVSGSIALASCAYGPQTPVNLPLTGDIDAYERFITLERTSGGASPSARRNDRYTTPESVAGLREFTKRYEFDAWLQAHPKLPQTVIFMSLSGGGLRAATLAQSVLVALSQYRVPGEIGLDGPAGADHSLADDVILISAASGGATVGTAFALGQTRQIDEQSAFARNFLTSSLARNMGRELWPSNWLDRTRPYRQAYDADVSGGKTYRDLTLNAKSPFLILNSTDIASGRNFSFNQLSFSDLCSDLLQLPLADAIDAAGNFPYIETALTLHNFRADGGCRSAADSNETRRLKSYLRQPYGDLFYGTAARYWLEMREANPDEEARRDPNIPPERLIDWLHLYDGGLADNLGLRPLTEILIRPQVLAWLANRGVKRIAVIVVNARSDETKRQYRQSASPYLFENINMDTENLMVETSYGPIDRITALNEFLSFPLIDKIFYEGCVSAPSIRAYPKEGELAPCSSGLMFPRFLFPIVIDFDQLSEAVIAEYDGAPVTVPLGDIVALREHVKNISTQNQLNAGQGQVVPPDHKSEHFDDLKALKSTGRLLLARNPCFRALLDDVATYSYRKNPLPGGAELDGQPGGPEIWTADAGVYFPARMPATADNDFAEERQLTGRTAYAALCVPLETGKIHEFKITRYPGTRERSADED